VQKPRKSRKNWVSSTKELDRSKFGKEEQSRIRNEGKSKAPSHNKGNLRVGETTGKKNTGTSAWSSCIGKGSHSPKGGRNCKKTKKCRCSPPRFKKKQQKREQSKKGTKVRKITRQEKIVGSKLGRRDDHKKKGGSGGGGSPRGPWEYRERPEPVI